MEGLLDGSIKEVRNLGCNAATYGDDADTKTKLVDQVRRRYPPGRRVCLLHHFDEGALANWTDKRALADATPEQVNEILSGGCRLSASSNIADDDPEADIEI